MSDDDDLVTGGGFYRRVSPTGRMEATGPGEPDVWICRRVADFPHQQVPSGGQVASCATCQAPIVFNPARRVSAPKVCMQCARIMPLPIQES